MSRTVAPSGTETAPLGPTASMRLSRMTTSAFSTLVAVHGDGAPAAQHREASRDVARRLDRYPLLDGAVAFVLLLPGSVLVVILGRRFPSVVFFRGVLRGASGVLCLIRFLRLVLLCGALLEGPGLVEVVDEMRVAQRPVHGPAVGAPGGELPADARHPAGRKGGVVGVGQVDRRGHPDARDGHRVDLPLQLDQGLIAPRRHLDGGRGQALAEPAEGGAAHLQVLLLVRSVPTHRDELVRRPEQVDAVGALDEVRVRAPVGRRDERRRPAVVALRVRRHPDDLGARRATFSLRLVGADRPPQGHDAVFRPPGRREVGGGVAGQAHRFAATVGTSLVEVAGVAVPGGVADPGAVRRPRREVLRHVGHGEPRGVRAVRPGHPQPIQGRERKAVAARGGRRVADLADREGRRVLDGVVEVHPRAEREVELHAERDLLGLSAFDWQLPDLPAVGGDQVGGVGGERHPRQHVQRRPRFLVVVLDRVGEPALLPRFQVPQHEPGVVVVPRAEDEPAAVGRQRRPDRRAVTRRPSVALAGLGVVGLELVLRKLRVVGPVAGAPGVPDIAAVGRHRGSDHLQVVGLGHRLDPAAAVDVEQLELRQPASPEVAHGGDDVVAVRHPLGRLGAVRVPLRDLLRLRPVQGADPDVLAAVGVRRVDDARAVGREPRLRVEGHARCELRGGAPGDGKREQVAKVVEHDRLAVRTHVERDPASLGHVEGHPPVDLQREILVLRAARLVAIFFLCDDANGKRHQRDRQPAEEHAPRERGGHGSGGPHRNSP